MDPDHPQRTKKRKNPESRTNGEAVIEQLAFNENPKDRAKAIQYNEQMQFEDDFEDEYDEDDQADDAMDIEEQPEEEPEDDIIDLEDPLAEPEVRENSTRTRTFETITESPRYHQLEEGEELQYDPTAYDLLHLMRVDAPCLSFDILKDNLGPNRSRYPFTAYIVAGSQAPEGSKNKVTVMKMHKLHKTKFDGKEQDPNMDDDEEGDDEEFDEEAQLDAHSIIHNGPINRIRAMPQKTDIVVTFSEKKNVTIFDLSRHISALDMPPSSKLRNPDPLFTFGGHQEEGFALDWSSMVAGRFATGDNSGKIHIYDLNSDGGWQASDPLTGHTSSVEDVQWSPFENDIFMSCGVDRSFNIWDTRVGQAMLSYPNRHDSDVNVISWNTIRTHQVASGGDDGKFKVWDIRKLDDPFQVYDWHQGPITSLEWCPHGEDSILAVASEDDSITLWDILLTKDPAEKSDLPPQLFFLHQGQTHIKEVHWHKQIPDMLISTAADGFHVWKPSLEDS